MGYIHIVPVCIYQRRPIYYLRLLNYSRESCLLNLKIASQASSIQCRDVRPISIYIRSAVDGNAGEEGPHERAAPYCMQPPRLNTSHHIQSNPTQSFSAIFLVPSSAFYTLCIISMYLYFIARKSLSSASYI